MRSFLLSLSVSFQIFLIIGSTILVAFLIAMTSRMFFDAHQLISNTDLISSVYQVMGTIYAILLTFTLWGVWQNFTEANASVEKETYTLLNLVHILETAPQWKSLNIRTHALDYLQQVISAWSIQRTNSTLNLQENNHSITFKILKTIQTISPTDQRESAIFNQSLSLLNQWLDARRTRLLIGRGNSAKALWPLLFTGAFVLFLFHGLFVAKTSAIWIILLLGTSLVIGLTFYLIYALDSPFTGAPSIDSEPFVLAVSILNGQKL